MHLKKFLSLIIAATFSLGALAAVGQPAPDFTGTDSKGNTHTLSNYKGKVVVLEWTNPECPFVVKHYKSGNMQSLQDKYTKQDVVWLAINSGAEGKQGNLTPAEAEKIIADKNIKASAYILDGSSNIGKLYGATNTPHMFVIDQAGTVVYEGAIDSIPSADANDVHTADNYVAAALDEVLAGKAVTTAVTKPYGCAVKY